MSMWILSKVPMRGLSTHLLRVRNQNIGFVFHQHGGRGSPGSPYVAVAFFASRRMYIMLLDADHAGRLLDDVLVFGHISGQSTIQDVPYAATATLVRETIP